MEYLEKVKGSALHTEYIEMYGETGNTYKEIKYQDPNRNNRWMKLIVSDPRSAGHMMWSTEYAALAEEMGLRFEKDELGGKVIGLKIEFTKPGIYFLDGRQITVGGANQNIVTSSKEYKVSDPLMLNLTARPREITIWQGSFDGPSFRIDPKQAEKDKPFRTPEGIIVEKVGSDSSYDYKVYFPAQGVYLCKVTGEGMGRTLREGRVNVTALNKKITLNEQTFGTQAKDAASERSPSDNNID